MYMTSPEAVEDILEGENPGPVIESLNKVDRSDWEPEIEGLFFDMVDDEEFDELGTVYRAVRTGRKHNRLLGLKLLGKGMAPEKLSKSLKTDISGWLDDYHEADLWDGEVTSRGKRILKDSEDLKSDLQSDMWKAEKSTIEHLESLNFSGDLSERIYREVVGDFRKEESRVLKGSEEDEYVGDIFKALSGDRVKVFCHYAGHENGYSHRSLGNFLNRSLGMVEDALERFYDLDLMYRTGNELTFMGEQVFEMIQQHYEDLNDEGF